MAQSRHIKRRISAARNISKITKAMEMVAASKMRRAQDQATAARPYAQALHSSLKKLAGRVDGSLHPLLSEHQTGQDVLVVIGTDKGLCGSLNAQLMKAAAQWHRQFPQGEVVAVGRKAVHFTRLLGAKLHAQFTDLPEQLRLSNIVPITTLVIDNFTQGKYRSVQLLYMDFINTLSQRVSQSQLLPLGEQLPNFEQATMPQLAAEYMFEPDAAQVLSSILPYYVENTVYQAFLEARASEHSARMVTMKNASENAGELVDELQLMFNKSRQQSITNELLDITTSIMTV
ncbi:MAG: ATP synthase F1 subunit gamma [Candidatus Pacebacteria bacterium CG10_big_fil_rev_8_21_14_0_10_56_10]|nr:MAG: ATP synthase F1 subunit gamma [Candidatus Pacebacteria bacterium CG10_big_fil_rev_8_21_14_0_10_56_10]